MDIYDMLSRNNLSSNEMLDLSMKWTNMYMDKYTVQLSNDIKNEVYLFNTWVVWDYFLNKGSISDPKEESLYYQGNILLFITQTKNISAKEFIVLYMSRFKLYNRNMKGLLSSNYPETKQFIPTEIYYAIYINQYAIDPIQNENIHGNLITDDVLEFTGNFISYWNVINNELITNFK